jgi:Concanavalin A-like lectin/glucanases superfamily/IPT/TIG domain
MSPGRTLFQLVGDSNGLFDGSVNGIAIANTSNTRVLPEDQGVAFEQGTIDIGHHRDLDALQSFTIEATITPTRVGGERQDILEGQTPSVALFIEPNGRLVGSIHLADGWMSVDSGSVLVRAGSAQRVTFMRDEHGTTELAIDGNTVGSGSAPGPIENVGPLGIRVGRGMDDSSFQFSGTVKDLSIRQGVVTPQFIAEQTRAAQRLESITRQTGGIKNIFVSLLPDASQAQLQNVKDIMNAAGVQTLSDLDTLPVTMRTAINRGQVLVAPRKGAAVKVNWVDIAQRFRSGDLATQRNLFAAHLTNQNSSEFLRNLPTERLVPSRPAPGPRRPRFPLTPGRPSRTVTSREVAALRIPEPTLHTSRTLRVVDNNVVAIDAELLQSLKSRKPFEWPTIAGERFHVVAPTTIPIDSAVVIAGTLDLTEQQLVVEPNVSTLYVIAEKLICGNNAAISWRRPGGSTPDRAENPDLNGRTYSGVQPKEDSRDGLDGGDGLPGQAGLPGGHGRTAPHIEIWVKEMTGLPNLDFNGEDGIVGGRGQLGGRGGNGADGRGGERWWLFGWHCSTEGGDGGDGGNGGRGGDGGRGGGGGNAGSITIAVLAGTLEDTVVNKSFKVKNQGGRLASGGAGGPGGAGGSGGRSGNGETCHGAKDGHSGATGQPGAGGAAGWSDGLDGSVTFLEFTEADWDELMTRPWITQITPTEAFPGDELIVRGSKFTASDKVLVAGSALTTEVNADETLSVTLPLTLTGGSHQVLVRRADGTESNRVNVGIKPQLDALSDVIVAGGAPTLRGRAFLSGASVLFNGSAVPATVASGTTLTFTVPGTGGAGSAGGTVSIQVRNPDGRVSNLRSAQQPGILEVPFKYGQHNLAFGNFASANPGWGNYEDTFGTAEVVHEQLDPVFGHPILTAAYFGFYVYFLRGEDNGGLATGFCTSLASLVADRFWLGRTDTTTVQQADVLNQLVGVHGKLLSRQSLLRFHDQGRDGIDRVERTYREIEATFLRGTDRQNQPLLFFIPSGEVWDSGYFDKLSDSHCVLPWRFVYPPGRPAPQLTPDGSSTISDPDGVELFVWDCNHPTGPGSKLRFRREDGRIHFEYIPDSSATQFKSQDGLTLGMMRHGDYMLADHDLPFSGPFGLTSFIIDFLLSPADLQVVDTNGLRTGNFGGQLLCEIPGSHPCYLVKGMYLLPASAAMTRTITGLGTGNYSYNSITPDGTSIVLQDVATQPGHQDLVAISADANQVRFTPSADKNFSISIARVVNNQARALSISGVGGGPANDLDITLSPELNLVRVGNRGATRNLELKALSVTKGGQPVNRNLPAIAVPDENDLAITVTDWSALDMQASPVPFQ